MLHQYPDMMPSWNKLRWELVRKQSSRSLSFFHFQRNDEDYPTFVTNLIRFANDLRYFQLGNSRLPPGSVSLTTSWSCWNVSDLLLDLPEVSITLPNRFSGTVAGTSSWLSGSVIHVRLEVFRRLVIFLIAIVARSYRASPFLDSSIHRLFSWSFSARIHK